ncbi:MAG: DUF4395 domain-containing protein [Acidimicrobiales bacterium]
MALPAFPNPVNETSARIVAAGVVGMATVTVMADKPWLLAPLTYGFAARVLAGPTFSPLGQVATRVVTPRLRLDHRYSPGPPKRLAQGVGLALSAGASALAATGRRRAAYRLLGVLIGAAGLEAALGLCLGCKFFLLATRAGVVPKSTCEACDDIWSRYPDIRPATIPSD